MRQSIIKRIAWIKAAAKTAAATSLTARAFGLITDSAIFSRTEDELNQKASELEASEKERDVEMEARRLARKQGSSHEHHR